MARSNQGICFACTHQGDLLRSYHICCRHPLVVRALDQANPDPRLSAMAAGRVGLTFWCPNPLNVAGSGHGIMHGWFDWPWNFDPIWLESCDGFEPNEVRDEWRDVRLKQLVAGPYWLSPAYVRRLAKRAPPIRTVRELEDLRTREGSVWYLAVPGIGQGAAAAIQAALARFYAERVTSRHGVPARQRATEGDGGGHG